MNNPIELKMDRLLTLLVFLIPLAGGAQHWTYHGTYLGIPIILDSVVVENLTQGGDAWTVVYPDEHGNLEVGLDQARRISNRGTLTSSPNPFHTTSTINLSMPEAGNVELEAFDAMGRKVSWTRQMHLAPGNYTFDFGGSHAGVYLIIARVNSVLYTLRIMQLGSDANDELRFLGSNLDHTAKNELRDNTFAWEPGDEVRHTAYATPNCNGVAKGYITDHPQETMHYTLPLTRQDQTNTPCIIVDLDTLNLSTTCIGVSVFRFFNLAGEHLTCDSIRIGPHDNYLFSHSEDVDYSESMAIPIQDGHLAPTTVWVQFTALTEPTISTLTMGCVTTEITVTLNGTMSSVAPNAGTAVGLGVVCSNSLPVNLFSYLMDSPTTGGTWTNDNSVGTLIGANWDPSGVQVPGQYSFTYTVTNDCGSDSETVRPLLHVAPNAGEDGTAVVCSSAPSFSLFDVLGETAQSGGSWKDPQGEDIDGDYLMMFDPSSDSPGIYTYFREQLSPPPCNADSATVTVSVMSAPNAGADIEQTICINAPPVPLFNLVSGRDTGGTWMGQSGLDYQGNTWTASFRPGVHSPGTYTYTVPANGPCPSDSATVVITVPMPHAGLPYTYLELCSNGPVFSLLDSLEGDPDTNGTWTGPDGGHSSVFDPAAVSPNETYTYQYSVSGVGCPDANSTMEIHVDSQPNAGTGINPTPCENDPTLVLFQSLEGSDIGGVWTGPSALAGGWQGLFLPGSSLIGDYTYTVTNTCGNDQAVISVNISSPMFSTNLNVLNGIPTIDLGTFHSNELITRIYQLTWNCLDCDAIRISGPPGSLFNAGLAGWSNPFLISFISASTDLNTSVRFPPFSRSPGPLNELFSIRCGNDSLMIRVVGQVLPPQCSSVSDVDGNTYEAVQIGNQCWMAENLKTTHYSDGSLIPNMPGNTTWANTSSGAWCNYDNNPSNDATNGKLYNWYAVADSRGLCPQGWHAPSDEEWKTLEGALGMSQPDQNFEGPNRGAMANVGNKLKVVGFGNQATNASGFSAGPGGMLYGSLNTEFGTPGAFMHPSSGLWWCSTSYSNEHGWSRYLETGLAGVTRYGTYRTSGLSVRCIRD